MKKIKQDKNQDYIKQITFLINNSITCILVKLLINKCNLNIKNNFTHTLLITNSLAFMKLQKTITNYKIQIQQSNYLYTIF